MAALEDYFSSSEDSDLPENENIAFDWPVELPEGGLRPYMYEPTRPRRRRVEVAGVGDVGSQAESQPDGSRRVAVNEERLGNTNW